MVAASAAAALVRGGRAARCPRGRRPGGGAHLMASRRSGQVLPAARLRPGLGGGNPPDRLRSGSYGQGLPDGMGPAGSDPAAALLRHSDPDPAARAHPMAHTPGRGPPPGVHGRGHRPGLRRGGAVVPRVPRLFRRRRHRHRQARSHLDRRGRRGRDRGRINRALVGLAIKLSAPQMRWFRLEVNRETLLADFAELDLAVLTTVVVALNPVLALVAVPTVLLARRFMMHAQLVVKSRIDTKTGLLNAATWESEATAEIARAVRTRSPLSVALIDIDHFKAVNDTHGHLTGDSVLRAVSDVLRDQLRDYDVVGRFGGEEFVVLLPQTVEADALSIAERLRTRVAALSIPVQDGDA